MSSDDRKKEKGKAGKSLKDAMGFPYFLSKLIGRSMSAGAGGEATATKADIIANVNGIVIWLVAALILQSFITYWRVRGFIKSGEGALNEIRRSLFTRA